MSSFSISRVVLIGRLTKDPELRPLHSGSNVCGLRMACNTMRRDPEGDYQDKPNYFDVSVFGAHAENVNRYTHKGSRVAIDGRLEWREWETADQQKRQAVSVVADTVLFLDSPDGTPRGASGERDGAEFDDAALDEGIEATAASQVAAFGESGEDEELAVAIAIDQEEGLSAVGVGGEEDDLAF